MYKVVETLNKQEMKSIEITSVIGAKEEKDGKFP
jgi:hypothetical protein